MAILLIFVPVCFYLEHVHTNPLLLFLVSAISILGLISLIGKSVEEIAHYSGPVVGGFLNATFGNFTEMVIAFNGIRAGLFELIRASITGSILGNLILVMGLSMFYGGLKYKTQKFSQTGANTSILMLVIALFALLIPTFVHYGYQIEGLKATDARSLEQRVSLYSAILLLVVYILGLFFSLKTHRFAYMPETPSHTTESPEWKKWFAICLLCFSAILVGFISDFFVYSIEDMLKVSKIPLSELFMGVIIVAAIGNAVDGIVAIRMAGKDKMDISYQVAMGASIQVALLIAPLLVIYSFIIGGHPETGVFFTLQFSIFEIIALAGGVALAGYSLQDGESNWFEGAMFIILYAIFGVAFFFHP
ncbi:MAG: calcium/proton exchanger [Deltaproteobacteria bacterium GWA2_45_12]|nr:MAG: calcium/proton exchanger [Deltaproteobacteria bacterium GWA2_45_12]